MSGVMPPMLIFGRSLLYVHSHCVAKSCALLDLFNDALVQPFMSNCTVVALNVDVLLRLPELDVLDGNTLFLSPFRQLATDIFGAIIDPNILWFSTPFDDPIEAANNSFGW